MQSRYSLKKNQAYILGPEDLTKLINILANRDLILDRITAYCKDDTSRDFVSLSEFVEYENAERKEICSLHIGFESTEHSQRVLILFISKRLFSLIKVEVSAPDHVYYTLRDELDDVFSGLRPWYHFFAHGTYSILVKSLLFIIYFALIVIWLSDFNGTLFETENSEFIMFMNYKIPLGLTVFVSYFSYRAYDYFFPKGVFAFGQGASRFEIRQRALKWVLGVVFVPLLLGIFIKLVFR